MKQNGNINTGNLNKPYNDLSRLVKALRKAKGFSLHFVVYDSTAIRKRIIRDLARKLNRPVTHIEIRDKAQFVALLAEEIVKGRGEEIGYISNFDRLIPDNGEQDQTLIIRMLDKELLNAAGLKRTLVFFLPIYLSPLLRLYAPNLWESLAGLYFFDWTFQHRYRTAYFLGDYFADSFSCELYHQKQQLLHVYESLMREFPAIEPQDQVMFEYDLAGKLARLLFKLGNYESTNRYLQQQINLVKLVSDKRLLPEILNNLGILREAQGNFDEAMDYLLRALQIGEKAFRGDYHPCKGIMLSNIGGIHQALGHYQEAYIYGRKAMRIIEYKMGIHHELLIPILLKLGNTMLHQKRYEDGLDVYRRALQIVERKLGLNHPYIGTVLQNIGIGYLFQGKLELAMRYFHRNLETIEKALGPEHPYLAAQLHNLGLTHLRSGDERRALKYFYWALEIRRKKLGYKDPETGVIYTNIGKAQEQQGKKSNAHRWYKQAQHILKLSLPPDHPRVREVESNIKLLQNSPLPNIDSPE